MQSQLPPPDGEHGRLGSSDQAHGDGTAVENEHPPNAIERVIRRIDKFQQNHNLLGFPFAVFQKFGNDQAGGKAGLIAYYGLFALFPLLLLFTTILGYILQGNEKLQKNLIDSALGSFPIIGGDIQSHTHPLTGNAGAIIVSCLFLLYGALGLGLATQNAMNKVWNIPYVRWPSFVLRYLRGIAILGLLALSTIGSTVLTGFATLVSHGSEYRVLLVMGSLVLNFTLIVIAFMVMTAEPLRFRDLWFGAALAAVFWQALELIGSWYIGRELENNTASYGFFGIVLVLLAWIYLGAQMFLLAAEINVVQHYRLWPRSMTQPPLTTADRAVFERLAQMEIRRPEVALEVQFLRQASYDPMKPPPTPEAQ
jgi:YihY family inner membrane protein